MHKKVNLFFDKQFEIWQPCYLCPFAARHVPLDRAACHICTSFTKFTTLHTRLTRRMCALCIRRVCRRRRHVPFVCAYDKGVDYMTASFVFIISFAHCVYQHFKHLFYVVPLPPWRAVGVVVYKLQLTTAQRTFAHTSLPNHKPTNYVPHWQRATCNWQLPPRCT